jgi:hypothetical protein
MLEKLIATIDAEARARRIIDEKFVREQRILDEVAPRTWRSLRAALKAETEKYPKHFTFEIQPEIQVVIRGSSSKVLEAEYLSESKSVIFRCGEVEGERLIRLDSQARAVILDDEEKPYPSVEFVAERLLALILQ